MQTEPIHEKITEAAMKLADGDLPTAVSGAIVAAGVLFGMLAKTKTTDSLAMTSKMLETAEAFIQAAIAEFEFKGR